MTLAEIFASFPPDLQPSIAQLVEALREEFGVRRTDFEDLKSVVRELAEAQKRTEFRVEELVEAQKDLAKAQKRTEQRLEELVEAQKRTEEGLELFRKTFTEQLGSLKEEQDRFRKTFESKLGGLGARWGLQTEESFRQGMRAILQEAGFTAERFLDVDTSGDVFGIPDQVELDVVIKNGKVIVIEMKSVLSQADVYYFARKVDFYARKTGRRADRKLVVTPYAEPRAKDAGARLGVEICTDIVSLEPI